MTEIAPVPLAPRIPSRLPSRLQPSAVLELLKPITWFPPIWAFGCGVVSSGAPLAPRWPTVIAGLVLAGPMVCATSQAVNDWFDRHVDALNEPDRPIPSGRIPGRWGLYIALIWTVLSLGVATALGTWGFAAAALGLALAWAYSAPPIRLKQNGWWGNSAVGLCYEGLPWITAASVMSMQAPSWQVLSIALLYSLGAHGIMTLNDFKSIAGDRVSNVRSLPVLLGAETAARLACITMALAQVGVILLLLSWSRQIHAAIIVLMLAAQLILMQRLMTKPRQLAPWYNGTGVLLYVLGMLVSAFALAGLAA
ncbi:bacteriochlorophyll/chlorophyll a synthase [Bradyrhizobium sp. SSBR45G]|uniref:chlorophyll synthase ChlG n=1 Tax=unclassified Bradyrhizobium TaxID=2631580 RepID=UPI0023429758|nr:MULTISPECIES: chlorophyll synthase ChlG [unclassified Bradyrhizobium]GLH81737.1 bacteriochlorophyll/chlorophyll a synthase [Bradyrhizobium sp. SSBR45G]GLH89143.1 bacteriochlorophyll/chlorophyll a synthase [Bradyrhizobium sp. SSBR45R]